MLAVENATTILLLSCNELNATSHLHLLDVGCINNRRVRLSRVTIMKYNLFLILIFFNRCINKSNELF